MTGSGAFSALLRFVGALSLALLAWEAVGRIPVQGVRVFPPPSAIVADMLEHRALYLAHISATARTAALGFLFGNVVAVSAAILYCRFPPLEKIFHGVNVTLFALPMIVVAPILVLLLREGQPQIVLAATIVFFPTMAATLVGLRDIDPRLVDVVKTYGGGEKAILRFIRLRAAIPGLLAGLKIGASLSVLGAILGEFGSGERWGLGTFLLSSLDQVNAARLWGISLSAAGLAMAGFGLFNGIGVVLSGKTVPVTVAASRMPSVIGTDADWLKWSALTFAAAVIPFLIWDLTVRGLGLNPIIAPGPVDVFRYLFIDPGSAEARRALGAALSQTLPMAGLGLAAGLTAAFVLAALSVLMPGVLRFLLPVALVLQSTPLVALAPIVLLLFGREIAASLAMAILVVFFPAFVLLSQGFKLVPRAALEVVEVYGGGKLKQFLLVSLPYAPRYLFASAKLVAPKALLGVMVAEWLLTGTGLAGLVDMARGSLDYGMVWSGAVVSVLVAIAAYQTVALLERRVR